MHASLGSYRELMKFTGVLVVGALSVTDGGHARYAPHVSTKLYKANSSMDRDHDGVACER